MTDMLVELIQNFIGGAESTLNSLFNAMVNLVFFIERELTTGSNKIDFNEIYRIIVNYASYMLVIVFVFKAIKIYLLMSERR